MSVESEESVEQIEKWKDKYYDSLDQLEAREAEYRKTEEVLRSALSYLSIAALGNSAAIDRELEMLRSDIRSGEDGDSLKRSIKKIIENIDALESKTAQQQEQPASDGANINEVLLQLLERMELPSEFNEDVEQIKSRLAVEIGQNEWQSLIEDIANVVAAARNKVQQEMKEVGRFLAQLTTRLQELYESLQIAKAENRNSQEDHKSLSRSIKGHVQDIESSVHGATDLKQIKLAIQQRMEAISATFEKFIVKEEKRILDAQKRTERLSSRLHILEKESEELRLRVQEERKNALTDTLTGIYNRMAYDERMAQAYANWKRYKTPLAILVADVDFFKKINDAFGHQAGDKVLQAIASTIRRSVRETDMAARYGGEEFVVIMPDTSLDAGLVVANKLRNEIEKLKFKYKNEPVNITISCGVAAFADDDNPDDLFERADRALYAAKSSGRNCCMVG